MDLVVLDENETPFALRALRNVVGSNGTITPAERRFIEVIAELHGTTVDVGSLASIEPGEVAEAIRGPHQRKRVAQLAAIAAMVEGDVTSAEAAAVKEFARALGVAEASLKVLDDIAAKHRLLTRFDMMRRIMGKFGTQAYHEDGRAGLRKMLSLSAGAGEDLEVAWKYRQLIQFHLGMKVTPVTDGYTGLFDVQKVLQAAERGAACKVDLSDHHDLFAVADAPVEQLRGE